MVDKKIRIPWNKGKKLTEEHKRKIKESSKQYQFKPGHTTNIGKIPWNKDKKYTWSKEAKERNKNYIHYFKAGILHPLYKKGISPLGILIRQLPKYKEWKVFILKRDQYTCKKCGCKTNKLLRVHHKKLFFKILQEFLQLYSQFSPIEDKETLVKLAINYKDFWDVDNGEIRCLNCHKHEFLYNKKRDKNGQFTK